jgi:hypothetical protein
MQHKYSQSPVLPSPSYVSFPLHLSPFAIVIVVGVVLMLLSSPSSFFPPCSLLEFDAVAIRSFKSGKKGEFMDKWPTLYFL